MANTASGGERATLWIRWIARIWGTVIVACTLLVLIGYGISTDRIPFSYEEVREITSRLTPSHLQEANLRALEVAEPGRALVYNVGTGRGHSVREVIEACRRVTGKPIPVVEAPRRPGDAPVARVEADGRDLGLELLGAGLAWIGNTEDENYALAAIRARSEKKGLWAERHPVPPWSWRNRRPVPTPVPTHPPTIRKLSEMAMRTELEKNREGRTVIEGLPQKKPADAQKKAEEPEAAEDYHLDFSCSEDVLADCVELQFVSSFEEAQGGSTGTFKRQESRSDGEERSFVFEGDRYSVPVSCRCPEGEACSCSIDIQKPGGTEEEGSVLEEEDHSGETDNADEADGSE